MNQDFGNRLKSLRKSRQKSQQDLAGMLNVSQTTIANYEKNARFPSESTLIKIADLFQVSLDYLLGRTDNSSPFQTQEELGVKGEVPDPEWSQHYLRALIRGDVPEAWRLIQKAQQIGYSLDVIHDSIFRPALYEAGVLWQQGTLDIAQEHFISSETERFLSLIRKKPSSLHEGPLIVTLGAGDERHTLGVQMVGNALEEAGFSVMFLGSQIPFSSLRFILHQYPVKMIALSASMKTHVNELVFLVKSIRSYEAYSHISVIVGGHAFIHEPQLWKETGADAYAANAADAVSISQRLLLNQQ